MVKTPLEDWIALKIGLKDGLVFQKALEQYQLAQIRKTLILVKEKSLFYRKQFSGLDPWKIKSFEDFSELPFTETEDIRKDPESFVCSSPKEIARIVTLASSGTTGTPKRIYFTEKDQELTIDFFDYGMRNLVDSTDKVLILLPGSTPGSVGDLLFKGLKRLGALPIPFGPVYDFEKALKTALELGATSMVGIPTQVLGLARHERASELKGRIKSVLLSTDYVPQSIVRAIEKSWNCQVFNHYGMTEMGLGGGVQCPARVGYHLREADLYFEIVDPKTGSPLPDGLEGEVVFTTLTRVGMPLVRYRTGDLSRFLLNNCPCGTKLRSMDLIKNRIASKIPLGNNYLSISDLDEVLFGFDEVLDYQVQLKEEKEEVFLFIDLILGKRERFNIDEFRQALEKNFARDFSSKKIKFILREAKTGFISKGTAKRKIEILP